MPLLQDMLEAAYYASGGKKNGPFVFTWPTPEKLAKIERARQAQRTRRAANRDQYRRYARNWKRANANEANRRQRVRYHGSAETRERKANAQRDRRADPEKRALDSERLSRRQDKGHAAEKHRRELKHLQNTLAVSLAELERPSYKIETPRGAAYAENWPLDDEAARLIAFADHFQLHFQALLETSIAKAVSAAANPTPHGVIKRIDTAAPGA